MLDTVPNLNHSINVHYNDPFIIGGADDGAQDLDFLGTDDEADGNDGDDVDDDVMDDMDDEVEDDEAAMTAAAADDADMEEEILEGRSSHADDIYGFRPRGPKCHQ